MPLARKSRGGRTKGHHSEDDESTPICRCRVLYLGSAVPHITKDGLQGIQEPLKELYPDTGLSSLKGIDSWLSVWSNGLLLENVDEKNTKITRFFPIESLHYCAAVRNVLVPANRDGPSSSTNEKVQKFLPLDSPFAQLPNLNHPPLFACILRRTTGIKVLECHAFICKREMAANALVRCCFHAYADSTYAKQLENGGGGTLVTNGMTNGNGYTNGNGNMFKDDRPIQRSVTPLDSIEKVTGWQALSQNGDSDIIVLGNSTDEEFRDGPVNSSTPTRDKFEFRAEFPDEDEIYEGNENHKIWSGNNSTLGHNGTSELVYLEADGTLKSIKSHNSRLSRPRQFVSPPPPPPPPPQPFSLLKSAEEESSKKKTKKKLKKDKNKSPQPQMQYLIRPASMMNLSSSQGLQPILTTRPGSVINGPVSHRPGSAMSTMTRPRPLHSQQLIPVPLHPLNGYTYSTPHPQQGIYGQIPPQFAISHPQLLVNTSSKSKKKQKQMLTAVPILAPTPMPIMAHHHHQFNGSGGVGPSPGISGYHPDHHDHRPGSKGDMMILSQTPTQYATIERGYHYHSRAAQNGESSATLVSNKSKGKGKGSKDDLGEREGSPFSSSGLYRKGHLNERAFSYSIRQEHRSRSYGSLANLQFANETGGGGGALRPSGSPPSSAEGMKKEREIIQMVRDLDLSGDEIERSHVPPEMYSNRRKGGPQGPIGMNGYRKQNGHGPRITHR